MTGQDRSAPGFRVTVLPDASAPEGKPVDILEGRVLELVFEDHESKADQLTLSILNNDLALFEQGDDVLPGQYLEVSWGYPGRLSPPRRVVVKSIRGRDPLRIEALAVSAQAHREARARAWTGKKRSDVAREIAAELGYEGDFVHIDDTAVPIDTINQAGETDAALLRRLAAREGFEFWIDDTGFHWHARRTGSAPTHVLTWYADPGRGDILDWSVESNLVRRVGRVTVKGRDPVEKKDVEASADAQTVNRPTLGQVIEVVNPVTGATHLERRNATEVVRSSKATTPAEAKREAEARFRRAEREALKLRMTVIGDPTLRAKGVVELRGVSSMLSGLWYVASVKHQIGAAGYTCEMDLRKDGVAKLARQTQVSTQGGDQNRQTAQAPGTVESFERVDPVSGRTTIEYRRAGNVAASTDPEANQR